MAAPWTFNHCNVAALILCVLGTLLSAYAYYVETSKESDPSFRAFCDFSSSMSCSKVFTSRYGRGFGILEHLVGQKHWLNQPNSVFGIIFYMIQVAITLTRDPVLACAQVVFATIANIGSVYLAYILFFVLGDFCIVCVSMYIVNFGLLVTTVVRGGKLAALLKRRK